MRFCLVLLFSCTLLKAYPQSFTTGIFSGMNFTDFHGSTVTGKWQTSTGPVSGIFFRYALSPIFSVSTELNYTAQEYYYKPYQYLQPFYYPVYPSLDIRYDPNYAYYQGYERWNYSFWRIPVYFTLSTPTRLQLSLSAGVYVSFTQKQEYTSQTYYPYPWYKNTLNLPRSGDEAPRHDNGMLYAASISYPLGDGFQVFFQGRYFIGHKLFVGPGQGRTGVSEIVFGLGYNGFFKAKGNTAPAGFRNDSLNSRLTVTPRVGVNIAWFRGSDRSGVYGSKPGGSVAIAVEYRLDKTFSLISGAGFDRKGYRMNDSSIYYYRHGTASWPMYRVDTQVDLDYATIPLQLKIRLGSGTRFYLTAGGYWGIRLNARVSGVAETEYASEYSYSRNRITVYDDIEGLIRNNDFGWLLGAGLEFPIIRGHMLNVGMQYATGKTNILRKDDLGAGALSESDEVIRNGALTIYGGMTFPIPSVK